MRYLYPTLGLLAAILFWSHDMYLKPDGYYLDSGTFATIQLYNGTYEESENTIDRNRMADVSLVGGGERTAVPLGQWSEVGNATVLNFKSGEPGTWVAGVSTKARDFTQTPEAFNRYLAHDGVTDMLEAREKNGTMNDPATERYSKHVKTIFQVGDDTSDDYAVNLGYPIEFVPNANPYDLSVGEKLSVRLFRDGAPLTGELVYVDHDDGHGHSHGEDDHSHDEGDDHTHTKGTPYRTDEAGDVEFAVTAPGVWHLRTIHMKTSTEDSLTHESNWATLTFAVAGQASQAAAHSHGADGHSHDGEHGHDHGPGGHSHDHGDGAGAHTHEHVDEGVMGLPGYVWWGGSLVFVAGLFFYFNRRQPSTD